MSNRFTGENKKTKPIYKMNLEYFPLQEAIYKK